MLEWNDLLIEEGFGEHVVEGKVGDANSLSDGVRTIKAAMGEDREPKVRSPIRSARTLVVARDAEAARKRRQLVMRHRRPTSSTSGLELARGGGRRRRDARAGVRLVVTGCAGQRLNKLMACQALRWRGGMEASDGDVGVVDATASSTRRPTAAAHLRSESRCVNGEPNARVIAFALCAGDMQVMLPNS